LGETETRTVGTEFTAKDAGYSAVLDRIAGKFEESARHLAELKEKMGDFRRETGLSTLGALGLGYGIGSWIEKAREANTEFDATQKAIAGILASSLGFEKGASEIDRYNRSLVLAKGVATDLEEQAARFGMQVGDVAGAYRVTASSAGALGLTQKQVLQLTESSIAMAKRYGVAGESSATAIARALQTGKVKGFDPFDIALRRSIGNMQHLSQAARFDHIQRALQGSTQIAESMADGIEDSLGRARQTVDELFRGATGPLFHQISTDVSAWAKHLREAKENGKPLIDDISGKLVTGFKALETTSKFIKDHWVVIGSVFAGLKAGDFAKSIAGGLGSAGSAMGAFGGPMSGLGSAFGVIGKLAPALGGIVTAAGLAAIALHGVYEEWQGRKKQAAELGGFFEEIGKIQKTSEYMRKHNADLTPNQIEDGKRFMQAHAQMAAEVLKQKGLFENGSLAMEKFNGVMDSMSDDVKRGFESKLGGGAMGSSGQMGSLAAEILARNLQAPAAVASAAKSDADRKFNKSPITNIYGGVHITQKFEDQDPDRVFLRFKSDLENTVARRTMSVEGEVESH
jgi:hypothetical protein